MEPEGDRTEVETTNKIIARFTQRRNLFIVEGWLGKLEPFWKRLRPLENFCTEFSTLEGSSFYTERLTA